MLDTIALVPRRALDLAVSSIGIALVAAVLSVLTPSAASAAGCNPSTAACAPANDDLANAEPVPAGVGEWYTDDEPNVMYASTEETDPVLSCKAEGPGPGYDGVWYSITPTADVRVTVHTQFSELVDPRYPDAAPDTIIAIYRGTPSAATEIDCNDDATIDQPFLDNDYRSRISNVHLVAGTTYYVHAALWYDMPDDSTGQLVTDFSYYQVPANDRWVNAAEIDASPYTSIVTNAQNATYDDSDPAHSCANYGARTGLNTLWWTITPERDGWLDFDTKGSWGSHHDTVVSVHTGSPGSFSEIACHEDIDVFDDPNSRLSGVPLDAGTRYSILVSRSPGYESSGVGSVHVAATFTPTEIVLSKTAVAVTEGGASDSYDVRLTTPPTDDVVVSVTGDDQCAVSPATLTFTPTDHAPQPVTVSARPDAVTEGAHSCVVRHAVTSDDPDYHGLAVPDVTGAVSDPPAREPSVVAPPTSTTPTTPTSPTAPAVAGLPHVHAGRTTGAARPGKRVTYAVTLRNDADLADALTLRGTRSGRGFTVEYRLGRTTITRAVTKGTFTTPSLAPGATYTVTVVVIVTPRARKPRPLTTTLTARSRGTTTATDAVRLVTRRR
jgi:hypothetical protein